MRRFVLFRREDVSGVSGVGPVAEGIQFSDGRIVLSWTAGPRTLALYDTIHDVVAIHGHDGRTEVQWLDA